VHLVREASVVAVVDLARVQDVAQDVEAVVDLARVQDVDLARVAVVQFARAWVLLNAVHLVREANVEAVVDPVRVQDVDLAEVPARAPNVVQERHAKS